MRFREVTAADFDDMEKPGAAFLAVSAEVLRIGGGLLLDHALSSDGGETDKVAAYNKIVRVLNTRDGEWTRADFCNALEIPYFQEARRPGLLARLNYLVTGSRA